MRATQALKTPMQRMPQVRLALRAGAASPSGFTLLLGIAAQLQQRGSLSTATPPASSGNTTEQIHRLDLPAEKHVRCCTNSWRTTYRTFECALPQCCMAIDVSYLQPMPLQSSLLPG